MSNAIERRALIALFRNHPDTSPNERYGWGTPLLAAERREALLRWSASLTDWRLLSMRNFGSVALAWVREAAAEHHATRASTGAGLAAELRGDGPCADCGTLDNIVWFTDNVFWNAVTGENVVHEEPYGAILCVTCFVQRTHDAGMSPTGWRLLPEWPIRLTAAARLPAAPDEDDGETPVRMIPEADET